MVARTLDTTRGDAAMWTVRFAGLGGGLVAVLGAVMLGWLAWPALVGGLLGGAALIAYISLSERTVRVTRGVAQPVNRRIRELGPAAPAQPDTRIAA
jgi:hypothetical protein